MKLIAKKQERKKERKKERNWFLFSSTLAGWGVLVV